MPTADPSLSRALDLIDQVLAEPDEPITLRSIVDTAIDLIDGCTWAGITRHRSAADAAREGRPRLVTAASSHQVVEDADHLQYTLLEGPCVDAAVAGGVHLLPDTRTDQQWPRWSPRVDALGIRSVASAHLGTSKQNIGGLNLYSDRPHAFDDVDIAHLHDYAAQAAIALAVAHRISGLATALISRHTIGVAQGILVARHGLSVDQAFGVLVRIARPNNVTVRDLAAQIVEHKGLPDRYRGDAY